MMGSFSLSFAKEVSAPLVAKKVFSFPFGQMQRYVNFDFIVPRGNCGNVETYQFSKEFGKNAKSNWKLLEIGSVAKKGWYRFSKSSDSCNAKFEIQGNLSEIANISTWSVLEIEPGEVGLFSKDNWEQGNHFELSENDAQFSYYLLMPHNEVNTSLDVIIKGDEFIYMHGKCVGAIIADSFGNLSQKIDLQNAKDTGVLDIMISDDDVVVLIYEEEQKEAKKIASKL